jgi:hypothetical protein
MSNEIKVEVTICDLKLTVSGNYYPAEPMVLYDDNMEGYPGSPAEFELHSVELAGIDITEIISGDILDEIIEKVIKDQES